MILLTVYNESFQQQILQKSVQLEPSWCEQTDRHADGRTEMTNLISALGDHAETCKNASYLTGQNISAFIEPKAEFPPYRWYLLLGCNSGCSLAKFYQRYGKTCCFQRQCIFINLHHSRLHHIPEVSVLGSQCLQHHKFHDIRACVFFSPPLNPLRSHSAQSTTPKVASPALPSFNTNPYLYLRSCFYKWKLPTKMLQAFLSSVIYGTHSPVSLSVVNP